MDWGLNMTDTIETPKQAARRLIGSKLDMGYVAEAFHIYTDIESNPLYWKIRLKHSVEDKYIRPMALIDGVYMLKEPVFSNGKPLYNLHRLANKNDETVWLVEGEKCADTLVKLGLLATTSGSADSVRTADWQPVAGRNVILWRDNDNAGNKWQADLIATLNPLNCKIKCIDVEVLNLPAKGDCVEWIATYELTHNRKPETFDLDALQLIDSNIQAPISDNLGAGDTNNNQPEWGAPLPLVSIDTTAEPYPIESLPKVLADAIKEVQAYVKAPLPMVATSALSALAVAGQGQVNIRRDSKLISPCSLFSLVLAESGERKSTIDSFFTCVITDYEAAKREEAKPEIKAFNAELKAWTSKQAGKLDAIKQASKAGKPTLSLENELHELENSKPIEPKIERLIYGDTTPEGLAYNLATKWATGAVISSEAGVVFGGHAMNGDSVMRNMAVLNVLWDGGTHTVDKRTSESFMVRNARLSMCLAIQPIAIMEFLRKAGDIARGSGFLARFLIACPESTQGDSPYEEPPSSWPCLGAYNRRINDMLNMPLTFDETGNGLMPTVLELSPDAKQAWINFYNIIENELKQDGELVAVRDVASKTADNASRIAGLLHLLQRGTTGQVSPENMQAGCAVALWHLSESRRFLASVSQSPELAMAIMLDEWLIKKAKSQGVDRLSQTSIMQHAPNKLRRKAILIPAIEELIETSRVREAYEGDTRMIVINPKLLGV